MDITGTLHVKKKTEQVSEKFKKREFVLLDNSSQYPQHILFQLTQDKCSLIDQYAEGSEIKVHFNLRGKMWTSPQGEDKYFNTLEAWKIDGVKKVQVDTGKQVDNQTKEEVFGNGENDDLPF